MSRTCEYFLLEKLSNTSVEMYKVVSITTMFQMKFNFSWEIDQSPSENCSKKSKGSNTHYFRIIIVQHSVLVTSKIEYYIPHLHIDDVKQSTFCKKQVLAVCTNNYFAIWHCPNNDWLLPLKGLTWGQIIRVGHYHVCISWSHLKSRRQLLGQYPYHRGQLKSKGEVMNYW